MTAPGSEDEIDLVELTQSLLSQWRVLVAGTLSGALLSCVYVFFVATPVYRAQAKVAIFASQFHCRPGGDLSCQQLVLGDGTSPGIAQELAALVFTGDNLRSLRAVYDFASDPKFGDAVSFGDAHVAEELRSAVAVSVSNADVAIEVEHPVAAHGIEIANAVAQTFVGMMVERSRASAVADISALNQVLSANGGSLSTSDFNELSVERARLLNRLENEVEVASVTQPALAAEVTEPRQSLIVALGGVLGMFLGALYALVRSARAGILYRARTVGDVFGARHVVSLHQGDMSHARLNELGAAAFGAGGEIVAICPTPSCDARKITSDFADAFGAQFLDFEALGANHSALEQSVRNLREKNARGVILTPDSDRDLFSVACAINVADTYVACVRLGKVSRDDVSRIKVAARGATAELIVLTC